MTNVRLKLRDDTTHIITCCTGVPEDTCLRDVDRRHKLKGYLSCGAHFVINHDGEVEDGRDLRAYAAYDSELNHCSVVICLTGLPEDVTDIQEQSAFELMEALLLDYPNATLFIKHRSQITKLKEPIDQNEKHN